MTIWLGSWIWLSLSTSAASAIEDRSLQFTDATELAGISFEHEQGASGRRYMVEIAGGGVEYYISDRVDQFRTTEQGFAWTFSGIVLEEFNISAQRRNSTSTRSSKSVLLFRRIWNREGLFIRGAD